MRYNREERTKILCGQTLEQYEKYTASYNQGGRLRCGPLALSSELELHRRLTAAAQLLEAVAKGNDAGEIDSPNLAEARYVIYRAVYICEVTIGTEDVDPAQFIDGVDYEGQTGLSKSEIEWRYAPNMDGPVGNTCPETGTDPATTILKLIGEAIMHMENAKREGDKSQILPVWRTLNQANFIANDIKKYALDNCLNVVDLTDKFLTDDGSGIPGRATFR